MSKKISSKIISYLPQILALLFIAGFAVYAWQEPTQAPPQGNVPTPINIGSTAQTKTGDLTINGVLKTLQDMIVGIVTIKGSGSPFPPISPDLNADRLDDYHAADLMAQGGGGWPTVKQWVGVRTISVNSWDDGWYTVGTIQPIDAGKQMTLYSLQFCRTGSYGSVRAMINYSSGGALYTVETNACIAYTYDNVNFYGSITSIGLQIKGGSQAYPVLANLSVAGFEY